MMPETKPPLPGSPTSVAADIVARHKFHGGASAREFDAAGLVEDIAVAIREAATPAGERNSYDRGDRVEQVARIEALRVKIAAYRVRDPDTHQYGCLQFHMTYDNTVMAVMEEEAARLFARFVVNTVNGGPQAAREDCS